MIQHGAQPTHILNGPLVLLIRLKDLEELFVRVTIVDESVLDFVYVVDGMVEFDKRASSCELLLLSGSERESRNGRTGARGGTQVTRLGGHRHGRKVGWRAALLLV